MFRGPMVSVATPFMPDLQLDLDALRSNIRFMIDQGMRTGRGVLLVAAAGGEFPMLNMEERKKIIETSVEVAQGRIPVAASIQFVGTREVVELARFAHQAGASLGQLSAPYYYPPSDDDIFYLFKTVSEETDLPIMIYNNWWNTRNMNVEMVARLAQLSSVVALKWSAPSPTEFTEGLHLFADTLAIIDNEGRYVWPHMMGATAFITHVSNFWPEYPLAIWDSMERGEYGDVVQKLASFQWRWHKWVGKVTMETEGEGPFIKAAMECVGLKAGPPRPPARPVSPSLRQELASLFAEVGVPKLGV